MNENIDLTKILKDCPKGWKLYSPIFGEMEFSKIGDNEYSIIVTQGCHTASFTKEGFYYADVNGECLLFPSKDQKDWSKFTAPWYKKEEKLVKPKFKVGDRVRRKGTNKNNVYEITKVYDESYGIAGLNLVIYMKYQDQYELVHNKFDPKTLKAFDKVLVKDFDETSYWTCNLFSHYNKNKGFYYCSSVPFDVCIPYNDDTKHLVGTTDEAPEFYRYWED